MIAQNTVMRVVVTLDLNGESKAQNVYHIRHETATSQEDDDVLDAVGNWIDQLYDEIQGHVSDDVSIEKIEVYEQSASTWIPVGVKTITWAGNDAQPRIPSGVCMMVMAYKSRSGYADRKYLAGYCEDTLDGDSWISVALTNAGNFADNWIEAYSDPNGVDLQAVHWDRGATLPRDYVSSDVSTVVSYQRRRRPGRGLT